jgi:hypothetical protein
MGIGQWAWVIGDGELGIGDGETRRQGDKETHINLTFNL